ncbi:hypothetical protein J1N35_043724 [Gossypium stocksii]|uniref:Uncharacterized protein n=1 Tax=Gossypium stocksii TaxID=47602 RepID=A0A9D3ZFC2_9ROSI|nr:hypothetical protein J1N35_043724 [Gossypium stocksii]
MELEVHVSPPTLGSYNPELGTEALTLVVREVLEGVFEARIRETSGTLQARCMDCGRKRDRSSPRLEPYSAKHVRTYLSDSKVDGSKGNTVGFDILLCGKDGFNGFFNGGFEAILGWSCDLPSGHMGLFRVTRSCDIVN